MAIDYKWYYTSSILERKKKGLPFVCHFLHVSGSSLPDLLFGVGNIDQIKLQAEVTVYGITAFSRMVGHEYLY